MEYSISTCDEDECDYHALVKVRFAQYPYVIVRFTSNSIDRFDYDLKKLLEAEGTKYSDEYSISFRNGTLSLHMDKYMDSCGIVFIRMNIKFTDEIRTAFMNMVTDLNKMQP